MSAEVYSRTAHIVAGHNSDFDWDAFDAVLYDGGNYVEESREDARVARYAVGTSRDALPDVFGTLPHARESGNGGVMRTPALIEPLLTAKARVELTDVGAPQLAKAREWVGRAKAGDLGHWSKHEKTMAAEDPRWSGAIARLCARAVVLKQSLYDLEAESTSAAIDGHTACSITNEEEEYEFGLEKFYGSVERGGYAFRFPMWGSTGYMVSGQFFPAFSTFPDAEVERARRMGMRVIRPPLFVPRPEEPGHHTARHTNDPTTYVGFGAIFLQRLR